MRIAIVGGGIAGLGAAWLLSRQGRHVTLFEAEARLGGHSHTVDVEVDGIVHPVDTGFLVFNDRTYPNLIRLFDTLGVASVASEMSFSCRVDRDGVEWAGTNLATVFAQPANLVRPAFLGMLADLLRFNRETTALYRADSMSAVTLGEFLDERAYGRPFRDWYLLPMAAAIWSAPSRDILDFPLPAFVRFCANHGLLQVADRPRWRTVVGGSRSYVEKIAAALPDVRLASPVRRVRRRADGVDVEAGDRPAEHFDAIVLACHSDQALALLAEPSRDEKRLLSAVRFQPNRVVLHTDARLLPKRRRAWSAWNSLAIEDPSAPVAVSYLINRLQPLPFDTPVVVTLNPPFEPDPARVLREFEYAHPLLDARACDAQRGFAALQGRDRTWYAGAWLGYGFHEDGFASAQDVAARIAAAHPLHETATARPAAAVA